MLPQVAPALFSTEVGNDTYTKLLMHFNDMRFMNEAIGVTGPPRISTPHQTVLNTSIKKFGTSSLYFAGGAGYGYVFVPNSADFDFGTGDFTVDWWQYMVSAVNGSCVVRRNLGNTAQGLLLGYINTSVGQVHCYMSSDNTNWDIANAQNMGAYTLNTWTHLAVVRSGNTFRTFKDGVQQATWTSSLALAAGGDDMTIGHWSGNNWNGYVDEFRISKGIARWTANFAPPAQAYGPAPPDRSAYHTVYLCHFDGASGAGGTAFPDASPYAKGNTSATAYGHPYNKFGGGSVYWDAASFYLSLPGSQDFDFGSGDFTIDWWDWRSDTTNGRPLFVRWGGARSYQPFLIGYQSGNNLYCYASNDNASWNILSTFDIGTFVVNEWSHRALVRKDGTFYGFKDGVLIGTAASSLALPYYQSVNQSLLGAWNPDAPSGTQWSYGLTEELRVSKGIARWTSNFTPPTVAYA